MYNRGMAKTHAKMVAIEMRKAGHSYNYIAPRAGVSKSTVGIWVANIPYVPNAETIARIGKARAASGAEKNRIKRESFQRAREEAQDDIQQVSTRDLFMLGLGLYIGEGTKSTQDMRFVNANPFVINLIIRWFIEALGLSKEHLRVRLHLYPDSDEEASIAFWAQVTGIPVSQFFKSVVDVRQSKRVKKAGKLPYGTAHLSIKSLGDKRFGVFLARKIMAWSDIVLQVT